MVALQNDSARYGWIATIIAVIAFPPLMAFAIFAVRGEEILIDMLNNLDFEYLFLYAYWVVAAGFCTYGFRRQYLGTVLNFIDEHSELGYETARKFGAELFRKVLAEQVYRVFLIIPLAEYLLQWRLPNSIGDVLFILIFEAIGIGLFIYKRL